MAGLPAPFHGLAAEAPQGTAVRIVTDRDELVGVAVPVGPGGLPAHVRMRVDAIQPGGDAVFEGREWGPRGDGFRVDKRYREGSEEHWRSVLVSAQGEVLERSHSLPLPEVPQAVLLSAMRDGRRDVTRIDIVSGGFREELYRLWTVDRIGREYVVECDLDGDLLGVWRQLATHLSHRVQ